MKVIKIAQSIETLRKKLDKEIEENRPYSQILKTSQELDKLITEFYLEDTKDVT